MDQHSSKKQEYQYYRSENLFKVRGIMYWYHVLLVMVLVTVNAGFYLQKVPNHSDDQKHEGRIDLYSQRLPKYLDRNESNTTRVIGFYIAQYAADHELPAAAVPTTITTVALRKAQESFITLVIKFLNFCIAKSIQFRYSQLLPTNSPSAAISLSSFVFWVVLTRSVFSLYYS